ncbi:MAG: hypothetical protein COV69_01685 [Parcubacteria group bacterium CG11_big_fil_rev_8_21_14_0_20_39_14]|nr:MAG: hypothetical protein COV69_01685 [Parcubacteria group bacterium CG11_big_fil_rev_8_21_14_0_20_39_14]PIS35355.1 MAG: hypothetical protein COT36_02755 [Parcubacteria group bacterium CG08_land_8_20_14_0_20_38_56]
MDQKLALVTGACGFIGSHMVDYLISQGYKVRATDLYFAPKTYLNEKAEFVPADIVEKEEIYPLLEDVDVVFHLAAVFDFSASRELTYLVNVVGTQNLLEASKDFPKIKGIVVWSTGAFYDAYNWPGIIFSEESPVEPKNFYELSKLEQERMALKYAQKYNLPITVIRPSAVYGTKSQYGAALIILYMLKGQISFVFGKGDKAAAMVHVLDVVRAAEFLSKIPEAVGEVYNLADDSRDSVEALLYFLSSQIPDAKIYFHLPGFLIRLFAKYSKLISKIFNRPQKIEEGAIDYILNPFLMDNRKIKALGFEFNYPDVKLGMKDVIDWYLKFLGPSQNETKKLLELTKLVKKSQYCYQEELYRLRELLKKN